MVVMVYAAEEMEMKKDRFIILKNQCSSG